MQISRFNKDCGNSVDMNILDGYLFDFITNVVELKKEKAEAYFTDRASGAEEFKKRILLGVTLPEESEERYFLVGEIAANDALANSHISQLHNKITSPIPYVMFLAAVAYYHELKAEDKEDTTIDIEYFSTMLPIWLLKKGETFKEVQNQMAERFGGEHTFRILTPGFERTLSVIVRDSECFKEGEISRLALKKGLDMEDREDAAEYSTQDTVMVDLGGGSCDVAILPAGLKPANSRDSFFSLEVPKYLAYIDKLRKEKFPEYFSDLRSFDEFITENYSKQKFILKFENTGKSVDFTNQILSALQSYADILIAKLDEEVPSNKTYKYVYAGGVSPILEVQIMNNRANAVGQELAEKFHKVPEDSRYLNLFGLEIRSIGYLTKKKKEVAKA